VATPAPAGDRKAPRKPVTQRGRPGNLADHPPLHLLCRDPGAADWSAISLPVAQVTMSAAMARLLTARGLPRTRCGRTFASASTRPTVVGDPAMRPRGLTLQGYRGGGGHDRQPRAGPVRFGPASAGLIEQTRYPAAGEPAPPGPYDGHAAAQPGGDRRVGRTPASPSPAPARGHPGPGHTKGTAGRTPTAQRPARPYGHCAGHKDSGYRRWPG